jgi:methylaspartate ammonia-lyase
VVEVDKVVQDPLFILQDHLQVVLDHILVVMVQLEVQALFWLEAVVVEPVVMDQMLQLQMEEEVD